MEWEDFFAPIILERGYDYFVYGHVASLKQIVGGYEALVSGNDNYFVRILFEGDGISVMSCTCPYADDGAKCKHMAAALYAIDKQKEANEQQKKSTVKNEETDIKHEGTAEKLKNQYEANEDENPDIGYYEGVLFKDTQMLREIVAGMDTEDVRRELVTILENDDNQYAGFMMRYTRSEKSITQYINTMTKTADIIKLQCSDRHGFVDWRNADTYMSRLIDDIITTLHDFATEDVEEAKAAFDVSLYVYELYSDTDIDDDGQSQIFTDACLELWSDILHNANNNNLAKYMLDKLIFLSGKIGDGEYMSDMIDDFVSEHFDDDGFITTKLEKLDARIMRYENDKSWNGEHILSESVMERIEIMKKSGDSPAEIESYRVKYWRLPAVREAKMTEFESAGETEELIKLLIISKDMDNNWAGLVSKYSKKLIECYKKTGETDKRREELFKFITVYSRGESSAFSELKQCYSEEAWLCKREELFTRLLEKRVDIKHLLAVEGLKTRLFETIDSDAHKTAELPKRIITEIIDYESYLRPEYNDELLDIYVDKIQAMAEFTGSRPHYRQIVAYIREMLRFAGGSERARELLNSWRMRYINRPAMQDELRVLYRLIDRENENVQ